MLRDCSEDETHFATGSTKRGHFVRPPRNLDDDDDDPVKKKHRTRSPGTGRTLRDVLAHVKAMQQSASEKPPLDPPESALGGTLKPYQLEGVRWIINSVARSRLGVLLADEMGLGKTFQAIASVVALLPILRAQASSPHVASCVIVLSPLTVVQSWVQEFRRFAPQLRVARFCACKEERDEFINAVSEKIDALPENLRSLPSTVSGEPLFALPDYDVLVTTPDILFSDAFFIRRLNAQLLVVDEAHRLRNDKCKLYQLIMKELVHVTHRILLTGTPVHNAPCELLALLRMASPSVFGDALETEEPVDLSNNKDALVQLASMLMLRREKKEVLRDLPPLREVVVRTPLSPLQRRIYKSLLLKDVHGVLTGPAQNLNNVVMQLRKCCNHPYMFDGVEKEPFVAGEHLVNNSGKLLFLDRMLRKLYSESHRVLIFSQFTHMLDILQDYLCMRDWKCQRLDGSVRGDERYEAVTAFQTDADIFVFLLSTRSGGVGLTLTAADTVIFYDSDWNPQMDLQAQQRAHRIGQDKPVTVYRLASKGTVEDVIIARTQKKLKIAEDILSEAGTTAKRSTCAAELRSLLLCTVDVCSVIPSEDEWLKTVSEVRGEELLLGPASPTAEEHREGVDFTSTNNIYAFEGEDYAKAVKKGMEYLSEAAAGPQTEEDVLAPARAPVPTLLPSRREKLSDKQRIAKLQPKWAKSGYTSYSLPIDDDMYEASALDEPRPTSEAIDEAAEDVVHIHHLVGDVTRPSLSDAGVRIIIMPVSNSGKWGHGGLFNAVSAVWPTVGAQYAAALENSDLRLGDTHLSPPMPSPERPEVSIRIALLVVQRASTSTYTSGGEIDLKSLERSLERLSKSISHSTARSSTTIHLPHIGGAANRYAIERIVLKQLRPWKCFMYYYARPSKPPSHAASSLQPADQARQPSAASPEQVSEAPDLPHSILPTKTDSLPAYSYEQLTQATICFCGFADKELDQLHALQRLVLLHGGVMCTLEKIAAELSSRSIVSARYVIVVPRRDFPHSEQIAELHDAGVAVVTPSWIDARIALAN